MTGRGAYGSVKKHATANVHVCQIDVAALISPGLILRELSKKNLKGFSLIIVPGYVAGDVSVVEKKLGVRCVKGPKHAADIPLVLDMLGTRKLSPKVPADDILNMGASKNASTEIKKAMISKEGMRIGKKNPIYLGTIPKIIAEIPAASLLTKKDIINRARYYEKCGASIIDISMLPGADGSDKIDDIVKTLMRSVKLPISIDTSSKEEIIAGVDAGVDLVLSVDGTNKSVVKSINVPVVVVPRGRKGVPLQVPARIKLLEKLVRYAAKHCPVIADPLLQPINCGFIDSLEAYICFRKKHPDVAMMMGAGNVTELTDADSTGINALLAGMASELNISLIFTTEASAKTRGSVQELSRANGLMYLSQKRKQPPKDLGVDMLYLKEKRMLDVVPNKDVKIIPVKGRAFSTEKTSFRIYLDRNKIVIVYCQKGKPCFGLSSRSADALYGEICLRKLVGAQHAAYIGKELAKAEIALRLGKNYIQDEELFNKSYT